MIIDLHADILAYLAENTKHTPFDAESRASIDDLAASKVRIQLLPIFAPTGKGSVDKGRRQLEIYYKMQPLFLAHAIVVRPTIENLSVFFGETESLEKGVQRLASVEEKFIYTSLTWNSKNRFGGGNLAKGKGLTDDGKKILDLLPSFSKAVDLSHTSDTLAEDILEFVDEKQMVIASHSNFRSICPAMRNLPDEIADAIVARGGVIGLTLIAPFVGNSYEDFFRHVEYGLSRGYENNLALGTDFFADSILSGLMERKEYFFPELNSARKLIFLQKELQNRFGDVIANKIMFENAQRLF